MTSDRLFDGHSFRLLSLLLLCSCCNFLYVWKVFLFGSGLSNGVTSKYDNWSDRVPICALGSPLETEIDWIKS